MSLRYLSVCSGIEAATVAWHPLGWKPVAFSEIEPFPSAVLAHHYPNVPNMGDMTKFESWPDESIDLLCGGTPCQAFSVAGLRKGLDDPRGNLTLTFLALARKYRPRWVVWENVPGVLSDRGNAFGQFLGGLGQLGYGWAYRVLDAQYFGVAQRRRRVFVVANLGDWRRAAAVLFEPESMRGDSAPRREEGKRVAGTLSSRTEGGGGLGTDFELGGGVVSHAPCAKGGSGRLDPSCETMVAHALRAEGFDASEDGTGRGTPLTPVAFDTTQITSAENRCNPQCGDPCHPLARGAHPPAIAFSAKDYGADAGEIAPTLRAGGHTGSHANGGVMPAVAFQSSQSGVRLGNAHATLDSNNGSRRHNGVQVGLSVRRLTPRECERLQGFPDDYTFIPVGKRRKPAKDGPRYKALGNSWAVPCPAWIGRRISIVENI